jgi:hypothetical protein
MISFVDQKEILMLKLDVTDFPVENARFLEVFFFDHQRNLLKSRSFPEPELVCVDVIHHGHEGDPFSALRVRTTHFSELTEALMLFAFFCRKLFFAAKVEESALQRQQIADIFGRKVSVVSKLRSADRAFLEPLTTGVAHQVPVVALRDGAWKILNYFTNLQTRKIHKFG